VRFWDASAVVPLLVAEATTARLQALASDDRAMVVWWATEAECASTVARLDRDRALEEVALIAALERLKDLAGAWHEVDPSDGVREAALQSRGGGPDSQV
jgi:hypothetical protein